MLNHRQENPLIEEIKTNFYNSLIDFTLDVEQITSDNIDRKISDQIQNTIRHILEGSTRLHESIRLPTGSTITRVNCPNLYLPFFNALIGLLNRHLQIAQGANHLQASFEQDVQILAAKISQMDQFKIIIPHIKQFILEAKGIAATPQHLLRPDNSRITTQLIRDSFYNEMVTQTLLAIEKKWIERDDLECQEAYVFFALPALTLIEAINQSKQCTGIRLLGDKVLTPENCPQEDHFQDLFNPILSKKADLTAVSANELKLIKMLCLSKEIGIPVELAAFRTPHAMQCVAVINEIASQISRRDVFKQMVTNVINLCLETLPEEEDVPGLGR